MGCRDGGGVESKGQVPAFIWTYIEKLVPVPPVRPLPCSLSICRGCTKAEASLLLGVEREEAEWETFFHAAANA